MSKMAASWKYLGSKAAIPILGVVGLLGLLAALYIAGDLAIYARTLRFFGFPPYTPPFIDAEVIRSAVECSANGIDVYRTNPCDPLGRVHIYSPLLLHLAPLGLHHLDINVMGSALAILYVISVALLFRPATYASATLSLAAAVSYPAVYALERGQLEIGILFLVVLFCVLYNSSFWRRLAGYLALLVAGLLKFFPIVLLLLAAKERRLVALTALSVGFGTWLAVFQAYRNEYRLIMERIPRVGYFYDQFWVGNLPFYVLGIERFGTASTLVHIGVTALFGLAIVAVGMGFYRSGFRADLSDRNATFFVAGSLLLLASFVADSNTYYRAIHLLLTVPLLLALGIESAARDRLTLPIRVVLASVFFLLWVGPALTAARWLGGYSLYRILVPVRDVGWLFGMTAIGALTAVILYCAVTRDRGARA
jgi:hypothetical protein